MRSIKTRLLKLESVSNIELRPVHIMRIIVDVGGIVPVGYRCGEIETIRQPDESEEEFKTHCHDAVHWPIGGNYRHIFDPIYAGH
jgi:hypothetical protein